MNLAIVISQSTTEPITVVEAASNLRADGADDSPPNIFAPVAARIAKLITAARQACENELESSLIRKVLEVAQPNWWSDPMCALGVELPWGPVRSIVSVKYTDIDGNEQTLADDQYRYSIYEKTPVLLPAYGVSWPSLRGPDAVRVRYDVGYPSDDSPPDLVPETTVQAMHLYIAHYFNNREAVDDNRLAPLPLGVRSLLWPGRLGLGV